MDTIDRIEQTLDTLRPYIASHRGQVEVVDFDEQDGTLLLRLGGTCHGCAASTVTLKQGIEAPPPGAGARGQARGGGLVADVARGAGRRGPRRHPESPARQRPALGRHDPRPHRDRSRAASASPSCSPPRTRPPWCARRAPPCRASRACAATTIKITVTNPAGPARRPPTAHRPVPAPPAGAPHARRAAEPGPDHRDLVGQGRGRASPPSRPTSRSPWRRTGARVGLMDADIYGPNIPRMFGVFEKPPVVGGKIQPLEAHGVKLMSLGFLVERDAPAIWRGPIIMKIVHPVPARRGLGRARLLHRGSAARHRRRAALAGAGDPGGRARSS